MRDFTRPLGTGTMAEAVGTVRPALNESERAEPAPAESVPTHRSGGW